MDLLKKVRTQQTIPTILTLLSARISLQKHPTYKICSSMCCRISNLRRKIDEPAGTGRQVTAYVRRDPVSEI